MPWDAVPEQLFPNSRGYYSCGEGLNGTFKGRRRLSITRSHSLCSRMRIALIPLNERNADVAVSHGQAAGREGRLG